MSQNKDGVTSRWFLDNNKFYRPNPSKNNMRVYVEMEVAMNDPNTNDFDEDTKSFVISSRLRKDLILADLKREIRYMLPEELLPVVNNLLAEMSASLLQPSSQNVHENESESSHQREVNIPPEPPDKNVQPSSSAEEQLIGSENPVETSGENAELSSLVEEREIECENSLEPSSKNAEHSLVKKQEIESKNPLKPSDKSAQSSSSAKEQQIESVKPLEPFGEYAEQSFSAEELKTALELSRENGERFFSLKKRKMKSEDLSIAFDKKVEQSFLVKKQKIEFENSLKPSDENGEQSFSPKKQKIESENPPSELSLNRENPSRMAPQSHSTPFSCSIRTENSTKVSDTFDSAVGNEIGESANESSVLDGIPSVSRALFDSARENSSDVGGAIEKNEEEGDFSDSGVAESDVAGQHSTKHFRYCLKL